jgi:alkylation response protein AidB-like acyl-CoA dehydrogenase
MRETPEQRALRGAVRALIAAHQAQAVRDDDPSLWRRLCAEIGVAGLAVPERFGGAGAGPVEVSIVAEELGRALAGTALLGSAVLATQALLASGDDRACADLLPGLVDGSAIAALAWTTAAGHWDPADVACLATPALSAPADAVAGACAGRGWAAGADWFIDGEAHYVLDGDAAGVLLVPAVMPASTGCGSARSPRLRCWRPRGTRRASP